VTFKSSRHGLLRPETLVADALTDDFGWILKR
jgi:hypothetical protein